MDFLPFRFDRFKEERICGQMSPLNSLQIYNTLQKFHHINLDVILRKYSTENSIGTKKKSLNNPCWNFFLLLIHIMWICRYVGIYRSRSNRGFNRKLLLFIPYANHTYANHTVVWQTIDQRQSWQCKYR